MNTYAKYCPNVFVAKCQERHERGEVIEVSTKYGKNNECIVYNLVAENNGYYFYSIVRADGFNSQRWAENKAEKKREVAVVRVIGRGDINSLLVGVLDARSEGKA